MGFKTILRIVVVGLVGLLLTKEYFIMTLK